MLKRGLTTAGFLARLAVASQSPQIVARQDQPPPQTTSTPPQATSQIVVTGASGITATYQAVHSTEFSTVSELTTISQDGQPPTAVYPGGWVWSLVGSPTDPPAVPADAPAPTTVEGQVPPATTVVVTGADGAVATYAPSQDPKFSTLSTTLTTTDNSGNLLLIFPLGFLWVLFGVPPVGTVPPPPTAPPPVPTSEGPNDPSCEPSAPPECTKTISYVEQETGGWTTTELGQCPIATGCVTGDQPTKTETIESTVDVVIGDIETAPPEPPLVPDTDEETDLYFLDIFAKAGAGFDTEESFNNSPTCGTDRKNVQYTCFDAIYPAFCEEVDKKPEEKLSKKLTSADMKKPNTRRNNKKRTPPASETACNGWEFNFEWTGGKDACTKNCRDAFSSIRSLCAPPGPGGMSREASLDVGCGKFSYNIGGEGKIEEPPTPPPPKQYNTIPLTKPAAPTSCYTGASNCNYWDIPPSEAHDKTDKFCDDYFNDEGFEGPGWPAIIDASNDAFKGASHNFKVLWKPNCKVEGQEKQKVGQPHPEFSCKDAMRMAFDSCNNGGRGGRVEVGCLEYYYNPINQPCQIGSHYCTERPFNQIGVVC